MMKRCSIFHIEQKMEFEKFKVARVVNLKLAFTGWFFYDSLILIKLCKMQYLNLDKTLLFLRNQVICLKNWNLWRATTTIKFIIFCWNFAHVPYLTMSTKGCSGLILILFRSWVISKNIKNEFVETRCFFIFANYSRFKQNLKNTEHPFVDITCAKFQ